jgi:hypothetical protein
MGNCAIFLRNANWNLLLQIRYLVSESSPRSVLLANPRREKRLLNFLDLLMENGGDEEET